MKKKKFNRDMEVVKTLIKEKLQEVNKILSDVPPGKCFWFHNGVIVKNIQELASALEKIDEGTFKYHVNKEKNDLARWIQDVIGDKKLARSIKKIRRKSTIIKRIQGRIKYLQNIKNNGS